MIRKILGAAVLAVALLLTGCAMLGGDNGTGNGDTAGSPSMAALQQAGGGALLQQLLGGNFKLASASNVMGVLGYCQKQGYAPSAAESVKDKLLGKLGLQQPPAQDQAYQNGLMGILQSAQGGGFNLSTLKDAVGKRACSAVANQAVSSFLGG